MRKAISFACLYKVIEVKNNKEQEIEKVTTVNSINIHHARTIMEKLLKQSIDDSTILRYEVISIVPKSWKL